MDDPAMAADVARALVDVGRTAIEAARSRDEKPRCSTQGAEVYYVCTNCHATFARETLRPERRAGERAP